jgi:hypothetical protein
MPKKRQPRRVKLDGDVVRGDPAQLVLGRDEQPARRHKPLPQKPKVVNVETIKFDIELRMDELRPAAEEAKRLEQALKALRKIK